MKDAAQACGGGWIRLCSHECLDAPRLHTSISTAVSASHHNEVPLSLLPAHGLLRGRRLSSGLKSFIFFFMLLQRVVGNYKYLLNPVPVAPFESLF